MMLSHSIGQQTRGGDKVEGFTKEFGNWVETHLEAGNNLRVEADSVLFRIQLGAWSWPSCLRP